MDPSRLTKEMLDLLLDDNLMRIHRDPLVEAAHREKRVRFVDSKSRSGQLWIKPLADGTVAAAFVNFDARNPANFHAPLAAFGGFQAAGTACGIAFEEWLTPSDDVGQAQDSARVNSATDTFIVQVPPLDVRLFHVTGTGTGKH